MKYHQNHSITLLLLLSVTAMALTGCLGNDDNVASSTSVGAEPIDLEFSYTHPYYRTDDSSYVRLNTETDCDGSTVVTDTSYGFYHFRFENFRLLVYSDGNTCAEAYRDGIMGDLQGSWTYDGLVALGADPYGYCDENRPNEHIIFRQSTIIETVILKNFCWAQEQVDNQEEYGEYPSLQLTALGCQTLQAADDKGNVAELTLVSIGPNGQSAKMQARYNGNTCSVNTTQVEASASVCKQAYSAWQKSGSEDSFVWYDWYTTPEMSAFEDCVNNWDASSDINKMVSMR